MWSNLLSWFLWAIVWWILTFLWSVWLFNKQRKDNERKIKIEKSLELLYYIDRIISLIIFDWTTWFHNTHGSDYYDKKTIDKASDFCWQSKMLYYYIFNENNNVRDEIDEILLIFSSHFYEIDENDFWEGVKEIEEQSKNVNKKLNIIKNDVLKYLDSNHFNCSRP